MFENVFAQALTACGCDLFYYMNRKGRRLISWLKMPGGT